MAYLQGPFSVRPGHVFAVGKIPSYPEFLQNRTTREPQRSFDAWVEAGMGVASHRYGPAWTDAFELGNARAFVWRAPEMANCDSLLCGVLFPSCDSVGRHYPLAVGCGLPQRTVMRAPHVVPLAFGDFLERLHDATADFSELDPSEFLSRLSALGLPSEADIVEAAAEYDTWCTTTPIERAWSAIFPERSVETSMHVIHELGRATDAVRGVESPQRALTIRLPLGEGGPASAALWLDIVRRLCRWNKTVPSTFWGVEDGALIVALGDAEPGALSSLWYPGSEYVYTIGDAPPSSAPPAPAPFHLDVPRGAPMSELLGSLGR